MSISVKPFGHLPCGCEAKLYTMTNKSGASVSVTNYGGILVSIIVPDKTGKMGDVLLGYDSIEGYAPVNPGYLGALIGRYANRIHNGRFPFHGDTAGAQLQRPASARRRRGLQCEGLGRRDA